LIEQPQRTFARTLLETGVTPMRMLLIIVPLGVSLVSRGLTR